MPQVARPIKPELDDDHFIFLTAFYDLSTCRSIGSDMVGDIPYTAILEWLKYWNIGVEESQYYLGIIPKLDRVFLDHLLRKREETLDKASKGKGGGGLKKHQPISGKARKSRR